jgi:hypothetical protein
MTNYRHEAEEARRERMDKNKINFDAYHLRQDWSEKLSGQSTEFLPKAALAVEQNAVMVQQGLMDIGEWFKVEPQFGIKEDLMKIKPSTIYKLLENQLGKAGFMRKINDATKLGFLGSLIIAKVGGCYKNKPKFMTKMRVDKGTYKKQLLKMIDKQWELDITLVRHEDYYPDPTGRGLYEMQDIYMDYHEVLRLATGADAIYDLSEVKKLSGSSPTDGGIDQAWNKARETGQNIAHAGYRKQIKLTEIWGNLLNEQGELIHENIVCTVANDRFVIQKPTPNPYWHQESPFIVAPLISVPHSVWSKAIMDAPTSLNLAINELFNLSLDGGMMAVHGIKQIRPDWLADDSQVSDGIQAGSTLKANSSCPPGMKVLERIDTAQVPTDALNMLQMTNQEFYSAAITNEMRSGGADFKSVRATAVMESSRAIDTMFSGMAKQLEGDTTSGFITPLLGKAWKVIAQHLSELDQAELKALVGDKVTNELVSMGSEEVFADTVQSCAFRTFGVSATLNKQQDFTKMTALLQTIASSEAMMEAFIKKYDFTKFLDEIMRSLDIPTYKIEAEAIEGGDLSEAEESQGLAQGEVADAQSQIPQAGAESNQGDLNPLSQIQQAAPQPAAL